MEGAPHLRKPCHFCLNMGWRACPMHGNGTTSYKPIDPVLPTKTWHMITLYVIETSGNFVTGRNVQNDVMTHEDTIVVYKKGKLENYTLNLTRPFYKCALCNSPRHFCSSSAECTQAEKEFQEKYSNR